MPIFRTNKLLAQDMNTITQKYDSADGASKSHPLWKNLKTLLSGVSGLEQLLDTFFFETQDWVNVIGMSFRNLPLEVNYEVGISAKHHCTYRLFSNQDYLGELGFSSLEPLSNDELEIIEGLVGIVILPVKSEIQRL